MDNQSTCEDSPQLRKTDFIAAMLFSFLDGVTRGDEDEDDGREWNDVIPLRPVIRECVPCDDMTSEPCDDRDDGFNKTSSQTKYPVFFDAEGESGYFVTFGGFTVFWLTDITHNPAYVGITYKVGDTTTFSPGPYDESLGVPVTVHFKG